MNIFDHVKKVFSKKENATASQENAEEKQQLIELYEKLEKEGFHLTRERESLGVIIHLSDIFDGYNVTNTLFQNGTLIIDHHRERVERNTDVQKEESEYSIVTKNENGEYIVIPHAQVNFKEKPNIDMRCMETIATVNGKEINLDNENDERYNMTPEFGVCVAAVSMLEDTLKKYDKTQNFFKEIISGVENGSIEAKIQAKSVCVDARPARPEEVGTKFTVWSHGKVEKEITVAEDTVFLTTLDKDGKPIVDESGHDNTYDMPMKKFAKKYQKHPNGHFVQDPTPMVTIQLPDSVIPEEGIKLLPPCWGGYEGTLMRGGLVMLPFNPDLSREQQIEEWKQYLTSGKTVDWYPNNEADTYSLCDKNGTFIDKNFQELYGQNQNNKELL